MGAATPLRSFFVSGLAGEERVDCRHALGLIEQRGVTALGTYAARGPACRAACGRRSPARARRTSRRGWRALARLAALHRHPQVGRGGGRRVAHGVADTRVHVEFRHAVDSVYVRRAKSSHWASVRPGMPARRWRARGCGFVPVGRRRAAAHVTGNARESFRPTSGPMSFRITAARVTAASRPGTSTGCRRATCRTGPARRPHAQELRDVGEVGARVVVHPLRVVLRSTAAAEVGAQDAPGRLQSSRTCSKSRELRVRPGRHSTGRRPGPPPRSPGRTGAGRRSTCKSAR